MNPPDDIDPETRRWIISAWDGQEPFGYARLEGKDLWIVSLAKESGEDREPGVNIVERGHLLWRVVNRESRPRRVPPKMQISITSNRIRYDKRDADSAEDFEHFTLEIKVPPKDESRSRWAPKRDRTVGFEVISAGRVVVESRSQSVSFASQFTVHQRPPPALQSAQSGTDVIAKISDLKKEPEEGVHIHQHYHGTNIQTETKLMNENISQNISGGTFHGPVAAVMNHCTASIQHHSAGEAKQLLESLHKNVVKLVHALPDEKKESAADDFMKLVDEVKSGKPKRKWYELSASGLMGAATFVTALSNEIGSTLKTLGTLFWSDFTLPDA